MEKRGAKTANSGSFKKGYKPISPGRKPLSIDEKAVRDATKSDLFRWFAEFKNMSPSQVAKLDTREMPLIANGILNSLLKFYENGDFKYISYLLDQIIGKADQNVNLKSGESDFTIILNPVKSIQNVD